MQATYSTFSWAESKMRIDEFLNTSDADYQDSNGIPARENLTFNNGYYVSGTVMFIDMRESKALAEKHTKPVLAKIYRAYISEIIAVVRNDVSVKEVFIEGDGVWAVFNTTLKSDVDSVFLTACTVSSAINMLNKLLSKKGYTTIKVGIGIDHGESLYIKAGYKGAGINEVVWLGKVVGSAANLCNMAHKSFLADGLVVSNVIYNNLNDHNKGLLKRHIGNCWHGNVIHTQMEEWINKNV